MTVFTSTVKSAAVDNNLRVVEEFVSHLGVFPNLALQNGA